MHVGRALFTYIIIAHFLPGLPLFRLPYSGVLDHLAHKTRPAYIHSDPNCPCTKNTSGLHTLEPPCSMYAKHARPTYTRSPIVHVRKTRPAYIHSDPNLPPPAQLARRTHLAYIPSNPNCPCAKMRFGFGFGFDCPCAKTRPAYIYYSAFLPGLPLFRRHRYGTTIDKCNPGTQVQPDIGNCNPI